MLQVFQRMKEQHQASEERHRADINSCFKTSVLGRLQRRLIHPRTVSLPFKDLSGELEDWSTWSRVHYAQLSALGCVDALKAEEDQDIKIRGGGFD